jgi:hypothetical protein
MRPKIHHFICDVRLEQGTKFEVIGGCYRIYGLGSGPYTFQNLTPSLTPLLLQPPPHAICTTSESPLSLSRLPPPQLLHNVIVRAWVFDAKGAGHTANDNGATKRSKKLKADFDALR